jgi:hypothetical protein
MMPDPVTSVIDLTASKHIGSRLTFKGKPISGDTFPNAA